MKTAWGLDKYRNAVEGDAMAHTINTVGEISVNGGREGTVWCISERVNRAYFVAVVRIRKEKVRSNYKQ